MRSYNIIYNPKGKYSAIVYPVSYINPIDDIESISNDLKKHIPVGSYVLFDLLMSNGDNINRFFEVIYDGSELKTSSLRIINLSDEQLHVMNMYYRGKTKELSNSILTPRERFRFATMK